MATTRICPHSVTLFNYLGENQNGQAQYACTLLAGVHIFADVGMGNTDLSNDAVRVHIFDDIVAAQPTQGVTIDKNLFNLSPFNLARALDTPEGEKPFVPYDEWKNTTDKHQYWTLNPEGRDYIAIGDYRTMQSDLPTYCDLFRIVSVGRREMGSRRMWHWRVTAR